jgi:hypothetical protein
MPVAPGDYNADGVVDLGDYLVWQKTFGSPTDLRADGNADLAIDEEDLAVWQQHFGTVYPSDSGASTNVPEPHTALAALLGALIAMQFNCCRRQRGQ